MRTLAVAVVAAAALAVPASAAAPRIVIFSGPLLPHPVVVSDWKAIFDVTQRTVASRPVPRRELARRPSLRVSMFWGPGWNDWLAAGHDPRRLRSGEADSHGRFYPAHGGKAAALDLPWAGTWPKRVPRRALAVLRRLGIPVAA